MPKFMRKITDNRFPRSGLLAKYKPFILKETRKYVDQYWLPFDVVLDEAVYLAGIAEKKFDPGRGYDFSTLLRHWLKGLHRFCQKEYRRNNLWWSRDQEEPKPTDRHRARLEYGDDHGRISWGEHTPALIDLEQHQRQSLRLIEKAVLDWMIEPDGRTLCEVAEWIGYKKSYASKIRYRLLLKSHGLPVIVAAA
jgi:hypothetical protein